MKNEIEKQGSPVEKVAPPRREFQTLLVAFLAMATVGTVVGGAEEAKAASSLPIMCGGNLLNCAPQAFHQFVESGFDRITPSFGQQVGPGTPGTPGFVQILGPQWPWF